MLFVFLWHVKLVIVDYISDLLVVSISVGGMNSTSRLSSGFSFIYLILVLYLSQLMLTAKPETTPTSYPIPEDVPHASQKLCRSNHVISAALSHVFSVTNLIATTL